MNGGGSGGGVDTTAEETEKRFKGLDKTKVSKMRSSMRLNALIREHSGESELVIITLPRPPREEDGEENGEFALALYASQSCRLQKFTIITNTLASSVVAYEKCSSFAAREPKLSRPTRRRAIQAVGENANAFKPPLTHPNYLQPRRAH